MMQIRNNDVRLQFRSSHFTFLQPKKIHIENRVTKSDAKSRYVVVEEINEMR